MRLKMMKKLMGTTATTLAILSIWGCQVISPSSSRFASVEISGHTQQEVSAATIAVFEKAGYMSTGGRDELMFERAGPDWFQMAYGSNLSGGEAVEERVRAQVVDKGAGVLQLECNAFAVQGIDKESALLRTRSGPYRDLLKQVAKNLSPTQPAAK